MRLYKEAARNTEHVAFKTELATLKEEIPNLTFPAICFSLMLVREEALKT